MLRGGGGYIKIADNANTNHNLFRVPRRAILEIAGQRNTPAVTSSESKRLSHKRDAPGNALNREGHTLRKKGAYCKRAPKASQGRRSQE